MTQPDAALPYPHPAQTIERADLAVFDAGELLHQNYVVQGGEGCDVVRDFLRRHYPSAFCARCLARTLRIVPEQARKLIAALRIDGETIVLLGAHCARCHRPRMTVQAVGYEDAQQKSEQAASTFL